MAVPVLLEEVKGRLDGRCLLVNKGEMVVREANVLPRIPVRSLREDLVQMNVRQAVETHFANERPALHKIPFSDVEIGEMGIRPAVGRLVILRVGKRDNRASHRFYPAILHRINWGAIREHDVEPAMEIALVSTRVGLVKGVVVDHPDCSVELLNLRLGKPGRLVWPGKLFDSGFQHREGQGRG